MPVINMLPIRAGTALHILAQEAIDLLKSLSGKDVFAAAYMHVHRAAQAVRDQRRVEHAMEVSQVLLPSAKHLDGDTLL